jgi:hypothetical protein
MTVLIHETDSAALAAPLDAVGEAVPRPADS